MIYDLPDHYICRMVAERAARRSAPFMPVNPRCEINARDELEKVYLCIKHSNGLKVCEIIELTGIKRSRVDHRIAELKQRAPGYAVRGNREGQSMIYFAA